MLIIYILKIYLNNIKNISSILKYHDTISGDNIQNIFSKLQQTKPTTIGELINSYKSDTSLPLFVKKLIETAGKSSFVETWNLLRGYPKSLPKMINNQNDHHNDKAQLSSLVGVKRFNHYDFLFQCFCIYNNRNAKKCLLVSKKKLTQYLTAGYQNLDSTFDELLSILSDVANALAYPQTTRKIYTKGNFLPFLMFLVS